MGSGGLCATSCKDDDYYIPGDGCYECTYPCIRCEYTGSAVQCTMCDPDDDVTPKLDLDSHACVNSCDEGKFEYTQDITISEVTSTYEFCLTCVDSCLTCTGTPPAGQTVGIG